MPQINCVDCCFMRQFACMQLCYIGSKLMPDGACKLSSSTTTGLISLNSFHSHCHPLQARQTDQVTAAATAEALSALLVMLVPPGGSPHDAPPPPGDLLTEPCLAGTLSVPDALASAHLQRLHRSTHFVSNMYLSCRSAAFSQLKTVYCANA